MDRILITLTVNGVKHSVLVAPETTLLQLLRDCLNLKGTKEGCGKGDCGACTVLMDDRAVNSCITLAGQAAGKRITTLEGLADSELHPLQQAFVEEGAVQCGFCIPGMIMSALALLRKNPHPDRDSIRAAIAGNLCRCTGYQKVIRAIERASGAPAAPAERH